MSQQNVEIVTRAWEAWIRGDLAGVLDTFDPAVEWDTTHMHGWPEDGVYSGRDAVRRFLEGWLASWERFESGADEIRDAGGDRVLVLCWQQGFGPGSEARVRMDWAQLVSLRRGFAYRVEAYSDQREALEAAGLSELATSQDNQEFARRVYDAFNSGDWDAFVELIDPDVEFTSLLLEAEGGTYRGHRELRAYFESLRGVFGDWRSEIVAMRDFGETLVIQSRATGTGEASGLELEQEFWQAARVGNGKVVWWKFCRTEDEALEAVGLRA